ncbi:hypothetical protein AM571_PC02124 (plasmid) [Rhizobium etli 8C-3]|uniref:Uncharacterized protein n=1 Tax=Rhizobium etli 8C-3 TaxID=538025 RepID=A0A1L5PIJ1_RHIET|nr:hypothetical protein AM571_PC02124 [Rhizobium etli 8C-3]
MPGDRDEGERGAALRGIVEPAVSGNGRAGPRLRSSNGSLPESCRWRLQVRARLASGKLTVALKLRRQHLKPVADGGAEIAAKAGDRIDCCWINVEALRIDNTVTIVRKDDFTEDSL